MQSPCLWGNICQKAFIPVRYLFQGMYQLSRFGHFCPFYETILCQWHTHETHGMVSVIRSATLTVIEVGWSENPKQERP
jgi:hypothetical protein